MFEGRMWWVYTALLLSFTFVGSAGAENFNAAWPGVESDVVYTGEVFSARNGNTDGGDGSEYQGNLDFSLLFDLEAFGFWKNSSLFVYAQNSHGQGISGAYLGDFQGASNMESDSFTQFSEVWLENKFFDDQMNVKVGRQDFNADFCYVENGGEFLNSSFGLIPNVPIPTFPEQAMSISTSMQIKPGLNLGLGLADGAPDGRDLGFDTAFDGEGGAVAITELRWEAQAFAAPTSIRLGLWHHNGEHDRLDDPANPVATSNTGYYLNVDQPIYTTPGGALNPKHIQAFLQFGYAPEDRNEIATYIGAGLRIERPFSSRPEDVMGLGLATATLSDELPVSIDPEHSLEIFYKAQINEHFAVQPDLQYLINPGGASSNAVALGIRFEIGL